MSWPPQPIYIAITWADLRGAPGPSPCSSLIGVRERQIGNTWSNLLIRLGKGSHLATTRRKLIFSHFAPTCEVERGSVVYPRTGELDEDIIGHMFLAKSGNCSQIVWDLSCYLNGVKLCHYLKYKDGIFERLWCCPSQFLTWMPPPHVFSSTQIGTQSTIMAGHSYNSDWEIDDISPWVSQFLFSILATRTGDILWCQFSHSLMISFLCLQ